MRTGRLFLMACCVAVPLLAASICEAQAADDTWKAAVARVDITPTEPVWLAGYGSRTHESEGTLHPIWAKALVLRDAGGNRAVLVTSDLLGFPKSMADRICGRLQKDHQLARAQIILNSSHTHSGPVVKDSLYNIYPLAEENIAHIEKYSAQMEDRIVAMVGEALKNLAPAQVFSGEGAARFAVNRRNNAEAQIRANYEPKGPIDHAVPVLKVARADGSLMAAVFGYACHNTTLCTYQFSGDYAGFAQSELEAAHPGATALYFAGCGADINPMPRRSVPQAQQYGRTLAAAVEQVLADPMKTLAPAIKAEYQEIELAFSPTPTREQLLVILEKGVIYDQRAAKKFLAMLDAGKPLPTTYPYPIQFWKLGDQPILAMGGEVVIDYAIAFKKLLGPDLFVMGYSNDLMGYIPSLRVLKEGSYEGSTAMLEYDLPCPWAEDVESRITNGVKALAEKGEIPLQ